MSELIGATLLIALVVVLIFLGPWFTILMLNALFSLNLTVSFGTWFAAFWFNYLAFGGAKNITTKKA